MNIIALHKVQIRKDIYMYLQILKYISINFISLMLTLV